MRRRALAVPVLAALVLAGCGAPSAAGTTAGSTAAPTTAGPTAAGPTTAMPSMSMPAIGSAAPTGAPVATTTVDIANFAFSPATITVKAGATVTWTNKDEDAHTVTANGKAFSSPTLSNGQAFSFTFRTPGRYPYLCTIHPFMTAVVVVTA